MPIPLAAALPLSAAALAYLNARYSVSSDLHLISAVISSERDVSRASKNDASSIFYILEDRATDLETADHPFLIFEGQSWTYAQAYETSLRYGTWLKLNKGVRKGDIVATVFPNCPLFIWTWMGLWSIGAKPALINHNLRGKQLVHCVKTSGARLILIDEAVRDNFAEVAGAEGNGELGRTQTKAAVEVVLFDDELQQRISDTAAVRASNEERSDEMLLSPAMLIYTSGTTGMPKPATMNWKRIRYASHLFQRWLRFKKHDVIYTVSDLLLGDQVYQAMLDEGLTYCQCMPLYHASANVLGCLAVITAGATLALGRHFSRSTFWPEVCASQATHIQYVGETCRYLLAAPPSPLDRAHKVHTAYGNGLRPDIWRRFKERFGLETIAELYAATESPKVFVNKSTSSFSEGAIGHYGPLLSLLDRGKTRLIEFDIQTNTPIRDPKTGFCKQIMDDRPGELIVQLDEDNISASFQGYYGDSKATSSKILRDVFRMGDAYFSTGDIMRRDGENRWFFNDRIGDTFRWKAENVSTTEVSQILGTFPGITEANVYGVQLPHHDGRAGCAAISLESGKENDRTFFEQLAQHVRAGLPKYAVPLFLRVATEMQSTGTHKQQKHFLREQGVDLERIAQKDDRLFWLVDGTYQPFGMSEWGRLRDGQVRL